MSYSTNYTDENGTREVSITERDSIEALRNDYNDAVRKYNPRYVVIRRVQTKPGEALHLKVEVKAPTHYLTSGEDTTPKSCSSMVVDVVAYPGYPLRGVRASYALDHYLASPNVFRSGAACIDDWIPFTSSLVSVIDKLVHDMIHDPNVTRYESMANPSMEQWHKNGVAAKRFPTIHPKLLYAPETAALPPRNRAAAKSVATPPPLPGRRR